MLSLLLVVEDDVGGVVTATGARFAGEDGGGLVEDEAEVGVGMVVEDTVPVTAVPSHVVRRYNTTVGFLGNQFTICWHGNKHDFDTTLCTHRFDIILYRTSLIKIPLGV